MVAHRYGISLLVFNIRREILYLPAPMYYSLYIHTHTHTHTHIYIYSRTVRTHFQKRSNFENIYFNKQVLKVYISFLWEKKRYQYTCFQICNVFENRCIILCVSIYNFLYFIMLLISYVIGQS